MRITVNIAKPQRTCRKCHQTRPVQQFALNGRLSEAVALDRVHDMVWACEPSFVCLDCFDETKVRLVAERRRQEHEEFIDTLVRLGKIRGGKAPSRRRALEMKAATPWWADRKALAAIYQECRSRSEMTGVQLQVDHLIPIKSKVVCGLHVPWNLRIIPAKANHRKSNRLLLFTGVCAT